MRLSASAFPLLSLVAALPSLPCVGWISHSTCPLASGLWCWRACPVRRDRRTGGSRGTGEDSLRDTMQTTRAQTQPLYSSVTVVTSVPDYLIDWLERDSRSLNNQSIQSDSVSRRSSLHRHRHAGGRLLCLSLPASATLFALPASCACPDPSFVVYYHYHNQSVSSPPHCRRSPLRSEQTELSRCALSCSVSLSKVLTLDELSFLLTRLLFASAR
jgi:hypothetical protein